MIPTRHPAGFTLTEALFGIAITLLISGVMWSFNREFDTLNHLIQNNLVGQHEANRALKALIAEARTTSISNLGAYPIVEASTTSLTFYCDSNRDGLKERIRYFLQGTEIRKGVIVPTGNPLVYNPASETVSTVVRDVANGLAPIFTYYDSAYDGTTPALPSPVDILSVRLIQATIIVDKNGADAPLPATYTSQISLRNLKDNI